MLLRPDLNTHLKTGKRTGLQKQERETIKLGKDGKIPSRIQATAVQKSKFEKFFKAGSIIYVEGDSGREMYIIKSGKVKILKQEGASTVVLAVLGPGSVLGELSLLDNMPRTATVQAMEDVKALEINQIVLDSTMKKLPPWFGSIIQTVVSRLRTTMKKNSTDLVKNNIKGVVELLIYLAGDGIADGNNDISTPLLELKERALMIIGLSGNDTDKVINELILSSLILLKKNSENKQNVVILDLDIFKLYSEYLTELHYKRHFACSKLSDGAKTFVELLRKVGPEKGIREKDDMLAMTRPTLEVEMERSGLGRYIDLDVIEELHSEGAIVLEKKSMSTGNMHTTNIRVKFSLTHLKKVSNIIEWMPVFQDDN